MSAKTFGEWVTERRTRVGLNQNGFARRLSQELGAEVTRDIVWQLEHGKPQYPKPAMVQAISKVVERPLEEALEALGYEMPATPSVKVAPKLATVVEDLPLGAQEELADVLPRILGLMRRLVSTGLVEKVETHPDTAYETGCNSVKLSGDNFTEEPNRAVPPPAHSPRNVGETRGAGARRVLRRAHAS